MIHESLPPRELAEELKKLFREEHSPSDAEQYYRERIDQVKQGTPTWVVRGFDSDSGRVYDFYSGSRLISFIDEEYETGCSVYIDGGDGEPKQLRASEVSLGDAILLATGLE